MFQKAIFAILIVRHLLISRNTCSRLICLFVSSCLSTLVLCFLVFMAEDDLIFFQRVNAFYLHDIPQRRLSAQTLAFGAVFDHESANNTVPMTFPPFKIVALSVFKAIGTFFGLVGCKLMIATVLWIKFDVLYELPNQLIEEPTEEVKYCILSS